GSANADAYGWLLGLASFVGNFIYWFPEHAKSVPNTGHLWSLSYEFQIYLILPLLFLVYRAVGKRAFLMALLCALPICLVGRAAFALSGISDAVAEAGIDHCWPSDRNGRDEKAPYLDGRYGFRLQRYRAGDPS
ncbi:acyltransferase family protein, partial [Streptococcus suis]|uniref:acyltransferase family protein n=1 Tax=Streptococcus suis TaxID=1307 RepID=UPI00193330E4